MIKMALKGDTAKLKNYDRKIKSLFMIYADFEIILVPQDTKKQNPDVSYTNKHQNHVPCSYSYKIVCVNVHFIKPLKSSKDAVYKLINSLIEESICCSHVKKKHFDKKLAMTKKLMIFRALYKCCICDKTFVSDDVKVTDNCYIIGKYRGYAHWYCNSKLKLNYKIPIVFHNLKNYDVHLIMQE